MIYGRLLYQANGVAGACCFLHGVAQLFPFAGWAPVALSFSVAAWCLTVAYLGLRK
jgi:hypothetical protein